MIKNELKWEKEEIVKFYLVEKSETKIKQDRKAEITFIQGNFHECNYSGLRDIYIYEDWMFLLRVAEKIKSIEESNKNICGGIKK